MHHLLHLLGYGDEVKETARLTTERKEINEEMQNLLDEKLKTLKKRLETKPEVTISYFIKDEKKEGGKYVTVKGILKKIDEYRAMLILQDGTEIKTTEITFLDYNEPHLQQT